MNLCFCPITLPDRRKSKGLCALELVQFRIELSAILNAAPSYCRIRECYPDGAIGADDQNGIALR
jgi:hypothetical protein